MFTNILIAPENIPFAYKPAFLGNGQVVSFAGVKSLLYSYEQGVALWDKLSIRKRSQKVRKTMGSVSRSKVSDRGMD